MFQGADKSLARPEEKQATATKLLNFCKPLKKKKNTESFPSNQISATAVTSASDEKWRRFNCFFIRVELSSYQNPLYVQRWNVFVFYIWDMKSLFVITYFNNSTAVPFDALTPRRLLPRFTFTLRRCTTPKRIVQINTCHWIQIFVPNISFPIRQLSPSFQININFFHKPRYLTDWLSLFPNSNPLCIDTHPKMKHSNCPAWLSPLENN